MFMVGVRVKGAEGIQIKLMFLLEKTPTMYISSSKANPSRFQSIEQKLARSRDSQSNHRSAKHSVYWTSDSIPHYILD